MNKRVMKLAEAQALPVHPVADLFPMYPSDRSDGVKVDVTLSDLASSIAENGVREALTIWQGQLIDGRNRLAAAALAGLDEIEVEEFEGTEEEVDALILDLNIDRRSLTAGQRALIAVRYVGLGSGHGGLREGASSNLNLVGSGHGGLREGASSNLNLDQAAARFRVSTGSITEARKLVKQAGEGPDERVLKGWDEHRSPLGKAPEDGGGETFSSPIDYDPQSEAELYPAQRRAQQAIRQVQAGSLSLNAAKERVFGNQSKGGIARGPHDTVEHTPATLAEQFDARLDAAAEALGEVIKWRSNNDPQEDDRRAVLAHLANLGRMAQLLPLKGM